MTLEAYQDKNHETLLKASGLLARSGAFGKRTEAEAYVAVQLGQALGIDPASALNNIEMVNGKISIGALLLRALAKRSGQYRYKVVEHDTEKCVMEWYEAVGDEWELMGRSWYTMKEAKEAGLDKKHNWKSDPASMLFARASARGARWYAPDAVVVSHYLADELEEIEVAEEFIDVESMVSGSDEEVIGFNDDTEKPG